MMRSGWSFLHRLSAVGLAAAAFALGQPVALAAYPCGGGPGPGERVVGMTGGGNGIAAIPLCEEVNQAAPSVQWADRWGATVIGTNGGFGASTGQSSERKASEIAKEKCLQTNGGSGCDDIRTYANLCIAIAAGQKIAMTDSSPSKSKAEQLALERCNKLDRDCTVYYSACSNAVRIVN